MSVSLFYGALRAPFFCCLLAFCCPTWADTGGIRTYAVPLADYTLARETLVDAIENEGLVISHTSNFAAMLERTAKDLGYANRVYRAAETFHFCSARAAWMLAQESPQNAASCPMSLSVYQLETGHGPIYFAYRAWVGNTPGQDFANTLLERIVQKALLSAER